MHLTAIMREEGGVVSSFCPELDVASQGNTVEEAKANLEEAVELLLEAATDKELTERYLSAPFVTSFEVKDWAS